MKQRERILELVKQGIISTEEALVLLENAAKKEGKEAIKKEQTHAQNEEHKPTPPIPPKNLKKLIMKNRHMIQNFQTLKKRIKMKCSLRKNKKIVNSLKKF